MKRPNDETQPAGERLQKILAQAGIASRRAAEQIILEGRVQVNGQTVTELGSKADPARDHIRVDGKLLHGREAERYFVLNKPRGYVTTMEDPEGRPTVASLLAESAQKKVTGEHRKLPRLYPVGRLDYLSEGLLLMTNDGALANRLSKAASGVEKTYLIKVAGRPTPAALDQLRRGVMIDRGRLNEIRAGRRDRVMTQPARIEEVRGGDNPWFEVSLTEGRNRQLRKMFEEIGHHVEKIRRIGYGALVLDVPPGGFRELTTGEVQALNRAAAGKHVERKKVLPEAAQLKKPVPPKRRGSRVQGSGSRRPR
jgi:23S rRNA pseudouridine2605 synthase